MVNLITFDEIIRLLRAKNLGLMTEDAVANQILKYREMENSVTSSNEHSPQDKRSLVVERKANGKRVRDGYLREDGSVEWVRNYH